MQDIGFATGLEKNDLGFTITAGTKGSPLDLYLGIKIAVTDELNKQKEALISMYNSILQTGRNNNSELAVGIREYTEILFELWEEHFQKK